ncbi:AraC family transcriptional regulator [Paenibacillus sp. GCM10028914]|uniref:AraC family transcriptional regulator n=1 Tax=Paenibacillus sp. GCM10028914 TaxID=3273416 RepID=UPI00360A7F9F
MAAEVIKVYREYLPKLRLIGKLYTDKDRNAVGSFADKWDEWIKNGWFEELVKLGALPESYGATYGMMRFNEDTFEYWIGMLFPEQTEVPEGYSYADIEDGDVAVCWIYGRDDNGEIFGIEPHEMCMEKINQEGWQLQDKPWFFERYDNTRFTSPDEKGNVILDYGVYIK